MGGGGWVRASCHVFTKWVQLFEKRHFLSTKSSEMGGGCVPAVTFLDYGYNFLRSDIFYLRNPPLKIFFSNKCAPIEKSFTFISYYLIIYHE